MSGSERPPVLDLAHLLLAANRVLGARASARIRDLGITPQQAVALMAIASSGREAITPGEIGAFMAADSPTVSGVIGRLERNGWVTVTPNPEDRRSRLVELTDHAREVLPAVHETLDEASQWAKSLMPAARMDQLMELLREFVATLEADASAKPIR